MIRDRPLTQDERAALARLFETLPPADQQAMMRRIRTVSQAQEWFDHVANAQSFIMVSPL